MLAPELNCHLVQTSYGPRLGREKKDIRGGSFFSFYDIPYASRPLRFSPSDNPPEYVELQSLTPENPRPCDREDCLYIHVHTPSIKRVANLPVIVFVPSDPLFYNEPISSIYGPEYLVSERVVVVVVNYRYGVLANIYFDDDSLDVWGECSTSDIKHAFSFIKEEIQNFGGDNTNITAVGHGFGAAHIQCILFLNGGDVMPVANQLFHKMILQSSLLHLLPSKEDGRYCGRKYAVSLGLQNDDAMSDSEVCTYLRELPLDVLLSREKNNYEVNYKCLWNTDTFYNKVVEDISNLKWKCPIIFGYNSCEGLLTEIMSRRGNHLDVGSSVNEYDEIFLMNKFCEEFGSDVTKNVMWSDLLSNIGIFMTATMLTFMMNRNGSPVYLYRFAVDGELNVVKQRYNINEPGACHGDELGYLFKTRFNPRLRPNTLEDFTVVRMIKYWTHFAKFNDPNPRGIDYVFKTLWEPLRPGLESPVYILHSCYWLNIGHIVETNEETPEMRRMPFWEKNLKDLLHVNELDVFRVPSTLQELP